MRYAVWVRGDPCTYEWCVHFLGLVAEKKKKPAFSFLTPGGWKSKINLSSKVGFF